MAKGSSDREPDSAPVGPAPEGQLIKRVRQSLRPRLPVAEAAKRAGLSAETWGNVERGYRTPKAGVVVPVVPTSETLARMAYEVGLRPDDLARLTSDISAEAAEILREMQGPDLEAMEVKVDRGRMLIAVEPDLDDEDREQVRRTAEDLAAFLYRRRQGSKE